MKKIKVDSRKWQLKNSKWKVKKIRLLALLIFILPLSTLMAQETIPATGGSALGSGGTVSYSVGQIVYKTNNGTNGSVAQGVQQPFEISVITEIEQARDINLTFSVYPNPTTDYLTLEVDASTTLSTQAMMYQLYDMQGKLLQNEKIIDKQTSIDMNNLVPATYFVKVYAVRINDLTCVTEGNKEVKTFKIIKK